ncbi:MAG: SRPBCC family protein [Leptolyngbyaceae cyanobacterium]
MTDAASFEPNSTADNDFLSAWSGEGSLEIATEKLQGRHRRISASISIPCSVEQLWEILTDYERLADFIPNLTVSRCIEKSETRTLLEQVGTQCFLNMQFCARVVLDMVEQFPHRIGFSMIEGDFKLFEGAWYLQPDATSSEEQTRLLYEVTICAPRAIPTVLIERHLKRDLTQNLQAIRQHTVATADLV